MSNPTLDQIQGLPKEEQDEFHRRVQKSLRRQWARAKNRTETEIDLERNKNAKCK